MDRRFWITVAMVTIVAPLSFLRRLDSLKYTSIVALIAVVYLVTIVVYHFISPNFPPAQHIEYFTFSTKVLGKLPVFIFAFTCHQNVSDTQIFFFLRRDFKNMESRSFRFIMN
jgi:amino acid permease